MQISERRTFPERASQRATTRLGRLLDRAVMPSDDEATASRKRLLLGSAPPVIVVVIAIGVIYLSYGEPVAGWLYVGVAVWFCAQAWLFAYVHHRLELAFWSVAVVSMAAHLLLIIDLGDLVHSGAIVIWDLALVAAGIVYVSWRKLVPLCAAYGVNVIIGVLFVHSDGSALPSGPEKAILLLNVLALSIFAVGILAIFVNQRDRAFRLLGEEQRKVRVLLLSILPEEIADELTHSPHVIADQFDDVSVLFADVVGFTSLSAGMTPVELVGVLDELFGCFDDLVDRAGLEKIKTIGDCYMVAAGIPRPRADHADALVDLALEMQEASRSREFCGHRLEIRVGVNSGSVVAGVIGRRKFSYDLWGDVVNTASRMESHGLPGSVQITDSTHTLVSDRYHCISRGGVTVKGKGTMATWVVESVR
jgi:guanylate cyclase